jgi:preprotein translocase subunit SecG
MLGRRTAREKRRGTSGFCEEAKTTGGRLSAAAGLVSADSSRRVIQRRPAFLAAFFFATFFFAAFFFAAM